MEDRPRIWNDDYQSHDRGSVRFDHWIEKHAPPKNVYEIVLGKKE